MRRADAYVLIALAGAACCLGGESDSGLRAAIVAAQQRCVRIYGGGAGREHGYATGLIVSPDGLILTAQGIYLTEGHVRVILPDGSRHEARVVRRSDPLQAALLEVEADTPDFFEFGDGSPVQQGDWVLAVSNAFNVAAAAEPLSVTLGIVSLRAETEARHRTQDVPYTGEMLLVDAITSNPGAPGGALCTLDGRLAGMVGKLFHSASTGTRINYAVPAELLKSFVEGSAEPAAKPIAPKPEGPAYLGVRLFTLSGKRAPAYVDRVLPGSPAENAGIRKDDLVLSVAGTVVRNCRECQEAFRRLVPGETVPFLVKRKNTIVTVRVVPAPPQEGVH
jgi:serine protease Do